MSIQVNIKVMVILTLKIQLVSPLYRWFTISTYSSDTHVYGYLDDPTVEKTRYKRSNVPTYIAHVV